MGLPTITVTQVFLSTLYWPERHLIRTHAYLSTHLSIHFTNLINRLLKNKKMNFPIYNKTTFISLHMHQCFLAEAVPVAKQQEAKNQLSGGQGGSFTRT